jgi:hypothetical protein
MKVMISCTENPKKKVRDELELFINKKVIFDEKKKFLVRTPRRLAC